MITHSGLSSLDLEWLLKVKPLPLQKIPCFSWLIAGIFKGTKINPRSHIRQKYENFISSIGQLSWSKC